MSVSLSYLDYLDYLSVAPRVPAETLTQAPRMPPPEAQTPPGPGGGPSGKPGGDPGSDPAPGGKHPPAGPSAFAWLFAWLLLGVILTLLNRTRLGHTAIYYTLLLLIFFVLVSNYRFITNALAPFSTLTS